MIKQFSPVKLLTGILMTSCLLIACSGESGGESQDYLKIGDHEDMGTLYGDQIKYGQIHSVVIKNTTSWDQFWNQFTEGKAPQPEKPSVDFNQQMVIGLFMEVGTPCTAFKINKVTEDSKITIHYQITSTNATCVQITADKGEIISIEKTDKEIIFHEIID